MKKPQIQSPYLSYLSGSMNVASVSAANIRRGCGVMFRRSEASVAYLSLGAP